MGCDRIIGVPSTPQSKPSTPHGISYLMGRDNVGGFPDYITGPVVDTARVVEIVFADHTILRVGTIPSPPALQSRIRFYATELPAPHADVQQIIARGDHNRVVARLHVFNVPRPVDQLSRISNHGKQIQLSAAMKHQLRLAHRSIHISLLASRDGRSFYHVGQGHCYGYGKPIDPTTVPPTRRAIGLLVGVVMCTIAPPHFPSPRRPVLDSSIYGATRSQPEMRLIRLAGFASDAVKTVNLLDRRGHILGRVPVIGNVYTLKHVPKGVVTVVPSDSNGKALAKCGPGGSVRSSGSYLDAQC